MSKTLLVALILVGAFVPSLSHAAIIYSQTNDSGSPATIGSTGVPSVMGYGDDTLLPDGMPFAGTETIYVQLKFRVSETPIELNEAWQFILSCSGTAFGGGWFPFTRGNDTNWSDYPELADGNMHLINFSFPVDDNFLWDGNSGLCNGSGPNGMDMRIELGSNEEIQTATNGVGVGYVVIATEYDDLPTEGPPPATTDFNEVINYIPDTGVNISVGTTTIGATFSIPSPDFVEYIGYRLLSPSNEVLYDATTTPSVAGTYEISTDYNFSVPGAYQGHAYFAQDFSGTIWEVDNPTMQNILIDVEEWSVDETGGFTQNPATTSTTTLPSLTLDCGDGFAGSICNLAARLFVPNPSSIGGVQGAWNGMMSKAPFSFFTESKRVLDAFRTGGASNGGTLSLTLYGESVPVISSTTASTIGLGSTQINFIKFLIEVGLWVLLAWYLYWRIASIFGV